MKFGEHLRIAVLMTVVTTLLLGLAYPLAITGLAQLLFADKANGQLIRQNGRVIGSRIIGQPFSGPGYFHSRPSAAGNGYDATASGGSNLGPTNRALVDRVSSEVTKAAAENPGTPIPIDMVTASASGLDPDISPAAAEFQMPRIARARRMSQDQLQALIRKHIRTREWGILGEPHVSVLELNLALDAISAEGSTQKTLTSHCGPSIVVGALFPVRRQTESNSANPRRPG